MKTIRIADLKHRVSLETPQRTGDGGGGGTVTWTPVAEFWAAIMPVSGQEISEAEGRSAEVTTTIYCRYRNDISPTDRLVSGVRTFEIRSVLDVDDDKKFLKLRCEEVVS